MAKITSTSLRHSYRGQPDRPGDYALKRIDLDLGRRRRLCAARPVRLRQDHAAEHHLGPADPTEGRVLFDDRDVTGLPPDERNIAQVFQFPVVYDTMTVYDNLAFPLRNRGVDEAPNGRSSACARSPPCSTWTDG